MDMRFRLFIQEHPNGSVTARVINVPNVTAVADTRAAALTTVTTELTEQLRVADREYLSKLVFHEEQTLRLLALDLQPKGKMPQAPIPISLNVLVTTEQHSRGTRYIVTAPRVYSFHLVVNEAEAIEEQTRAALAHFTRKWGSDAIIAIDLQAAESLETITVPLPDLKPEPTATVEPLSNTSNQENVLALCGLSLTQQVKSGRLGRADRREALVEQIITTLAAGTRSSVILVGRADVGKTALLHEVVERINGDKIPASLKGREVWFVTANNLIAGMKYTGEWQGRTQHLINQVRKGHQILYMGDPNEILDAGRWSGSDNNMGRFLRPYIESGELTVVCECSVEGFAAGMKVEPSFMNAFLRIDVPEMDEADTLGVVHAVARRLESTRNVRIDPSATSAILDLTRRFMPYRAFPGKAMTFLEGMVRDALPGQDRSPTMRTLTRADAIGSFTRTSGLPAFILSDEAQMRVPEVRAYFEERLLGQPDAVGAMVDLITVIKAGLNDPNKPLGSFFFVGPTGVGKTEGAKVLAEFLFGSRDRMIRFDMSEYAAADALPRLIGTAWKPESEGELTRRVREQPFCVVLFDELEKAHREVFDALLGVLGEGRLTDAGGRSADFRNAIIIMTSNLGASRREMQSIGFSSSAPEEGDPDARLRAHFVKEAERFFRPEFFNRIDRIVAFRPLTLAAMGLITRRELGKLLMREGIVRRNLLVEIDDAVIAKLLADGFHPLYGARPLQREIERMVILPLARLLVEQGADASQLLRFSVRDGQIHLAFVPLDTLDETVELTPIPPPDRRLETDLAAVLRALHDLRERSGAEAATPNVQHLRREVSTLLARTNEPTFWDAPAAAREVLSRIYHLERVLKRLDTLVERAEDMEAKGRMIRTNRDRRAVPAFAADVDQLTAEFAYLQMELAGAGTSSGHDQALVRVTPLGRGAEEWVEQLLAMYTAWAAHKGYEYNLFDPTHSLDTSSGRRKAQANALYVNGSNVYEFLRGEAGLHKLLSGPSEERQRALARVSIVLIPEALPDDDPARLHAALTHLLAHHAEHDDTRDDGSPVARVYSQGRHRFVRDPRTGVRLTDLVAVLEGGQIDPFLLASLRQAAVEVG